MKLTFGVCIVFLLDIAVHEIEINVYEPEYTSSSHHEEILVISSISMF